jgi:hypothetical protein
MRATVTAAALAVLIGGAMLAAASGAETTPDPGTEIKEGAVKFGHGVRDGAVRAWDAVKTTVHNATKPAADKPHKATPPKDAPAAEK